MKIIKSFLLVAAGLSTGTLLQAQDLKPEIAKPLPALKPATAPGTKPTPDLSGVPASTNYPEKKQSETELKVMETPGPTPQDTKDELVKPQRVPETKPLTRSASTLSGDKRVNADGPPRVLPATNTTVAAPPPVKKEIKKPVPVQQQPQQN